MSSKWTDYAENRIADIIRGLPWAQTTNLYVGLASAANDANSTEFNGIGYARQVCPRSAATWGPTQGGTSTAISNGTSHQILNSIPFNFGTAGSAWGTLAFIELWDAVSGGNRLVYIPVTYGAINSGDAVAFAIGSIALTLGITGGCSDFLANQWLDQFFRSGYYAFPATTYIAFCTTPPTNSAPGTEVPSVGSGYARVPIASTVTAWSGTQSAGSTGPSVGTAGLISNNSPLVFPAPTANWGSITHDMQMDQAVGGNMLFWGRLNSPKTVLNGQISLPSYGSGNYTITID